MAETKTRHVEGNTKYWSEYGYEYRTLEHEPSLDYTCLVRKSGLEADV